MFNKRIEATQLAGFEHTKAIVVSYEVILKLYVSQYSEKALDLCEPSQASLNISTSHHYEQSKLKLKCQQISYDPLYKIA